MAWQEGAQMYYDMMDIMNGYYDRYGSNGGGSGGLSASFQNTVAWGHIYHTIGTLDTQFGGSHNFGTGKTSQYGSNNEAWQEGYRDKYGDYPGMTWDQFTSAVSNSNSSSGRALAQFHGFNGHFFHYDKSTGDFYVPYTDNVINPVDVLSGRINWYNSGKNSKGGISNIGDGGNFTHIIESSSSRSYWAPFLTVHETTAVGSEMGNGPIRVKNGIVTEDVLLKKGPLKILHKNNGTLIGLGNFYFGVTDWKFTTSFRAVSNFDGTYFSVTNQYQLNPGELALALATAGSSALFQALRVIPKPIPVPVPAY